MKQIRWIVLVTIFSTHAWAQEGFQVQQKFFAMGLGLFAPNTFYTTAEDDASTSFVSTVHYPLVIQTFFKVYGVNFHPTLIYSLFPRTTEDKAADNRIMVLNFPLHFTFGATQAWQWSVGIASYRYELDGKGGTTTLNNGTGFATFGRPARTVSADQLALDFGIHYIKDKWITGGEIYFSELHSEKTTMHLMTYVTYRFGGV